MSFVIEDNVPVAAKRSGGQRAKYPWSELSVGQSFVVIPEEHDHNGQGIRAQVCVASKRLGIKLVARVVETGWRDGIRIWRIA